MTPIIGGDDLYVFTESTSPKLRDPNADKPYARHSPVWTNTGEGGEFLVGGEALETDSADEQIAVRDLGHPCEEPIHETIEVVCADPS